MSCLPMVDPQLKLTVMDLFDDPYVWICATIQNCPRSITYCIHMDTDFYMSFFVYL